MPVAKSNYRFFKYPAVFIEEPGIGHVRPPGEWLGKVLAAWQVLDRILQQEAVARNSRAKKQLVPPFKSFAVKYAGTAAAARAEERARFLARLSD